jgi:hypothetical protein
MTTASEPNIPESNTAEIEEPNEEISTLDNTQDDKRFHFKTQYQIKWQVIGTAKS